MSRDHYETMLAAPGETEAELKARWKKMAMELHPDRFVSMKPDVQKAAQDRFAEVSGAWGVLGDSVRRRAYDSERRVGKDPCPACSGAGRIGSKKSVNSPKTWKSCGECRGTGLVEMASKRKKGR